MNSDTLERPNEWTEEDSIAFLEYGRYFIPQRELQLDTICDLIAPAMGRVVDLCCGDGLLSERILDRYAGSTVDALDRSQMMLQRARRRLSRFSPRVRVNSFDLSDRSWRTNVNDAVAVVSMLALHHLDSVQRAELFTDLLHMLVPGGMLVVSDIVKPEGEHGMLVTAREYERDVRRRAREIEGDKAPRMIMEGDGWNMFRYDDPTDRPAPLLEQLHTMESVGFVDVDVNWMHAGHAVFSARRR